MEKVLSQAEGLCGHSEKLSGSHPILLDWLCHLTDQLQLQFIITLLLLLIPEIRPVLKDLILLRVKALTWGQL